MSIVLNLKFDRAWNKKLVGHSSMFISTILSSKDHTCFSLILEFQFGYQPTTLFGIIHWSAWNGCPVMKLFEGSHHIKGEHRERCTNALSTDGEEIYDHHIQQMLTQTAASTSWRCPRRSSAGSPSPSPPQRGWTRRGLLPPCNDLTF